MKNRFGMIENFLVIALLLSASVTAVAGSKVVTASTDESMQRQADVDYVQFLTDQDDGLKIFSTSGADPAMNGSYLKLAVFKSPAEGWDVFELANVKNYILMQSAKKGFLKFKLTRDTLDGNGEIIQKESTLYLNITNIRSGSILVEEISGRETYENRFHEPTPI